jgi:hypothetical protein
MSDKNLQVDNEIHELKLGHIEMIIYEISGQVARSSILDI